MRIIIVGCGRVGSELAYRLFRQGHEVTVIDQAAAAFDNLRPDFRGRTAQGDVLAEGTLLRIGVEQADALAAVTNSDPVNAVVAHVARSRFGVANVVVRSYAPSWAPMHDAFGSQVVSSTAWGAKRIEELLLHGTEHSVLAAGHGEVQVYELTAPETWSGRTLKELLPRECVAVALTRGGKAALPAGDTPLEAGDRLHVGATSAGIDKLRRRVGRTTGA